MNLKFGSAFAWWNLSRKQKEVLQEQREAGRFGGETAAGAGRAPYFYAQEHGAPAAAVVGKGYVQEAWERFRERVPTILEQFLSR